VPDGAVLAADHPIVANIVPANEVDTFRVYLTAHFQPLCNAEASITLTAPPDVADRVEVLSKGKVVATAVSYSALPSTARVKDPPFPFCFHDTSSWYTVRVRSLAGHSAASYKLTVSGHL
jgi:hypothetical protein